MAGGLDDLASLPRDRGRPDCSLLDSLGHEHFGAFLRPGAVVPFVAPLRSGVPLAFQAACMDVKFLVCGFRWFGHLVALISGPWSDPCPAIVCAMCNVDIKGRHSLPLLPM